MNEPQYRMFHVIFEVFTAVTMKNAIFWVVNVVWLL
jgi:hypothetical protein